MQKHNTEEKTDEQKIRICAAHGGGIVPFLSGDRIIFTGDEKMCIRDSIQTVSADAQRDFCRKRRQVCLPDGSCADGNAEAEKRGKTGRSGRIR